MQDVQKRLGVREADLKDRYTMIEKLKKEIDKYITENGDLKKTISGLEKEMKAATKAVSENISSNTQKEDLLKSIEEDFEKQKVKINQLENELKSKNIEIVDMAKLSEIGKLFKKIKEEEGDCRLMGKRSMDQNKEILSKLHKENKILDDTIKKKNAKIVEMFQEIDKLVADINSRDVSSDNLNQERNKLQQSLKKIEDEKSKLHESLIKKEAETRHWKEKFEKLQQEVKSKSNQLNDTQMKTQGLDGEIKNLKDQLDQKIQKMNSLSNKSSLLSETEKKLREEQLRIESLARQISEISGKLTQSEIEINDLKKKIKSKNEELEKALQDSSRRGSMQDFELNESRKTITSQEKLIEKLKSDLKYSQDQEKNNQNLLIETSSKLKGALMRLDAAEKTMAKYDLDHIDDKLKDLKAKGEAMGQAADRIKMAMNALKITVACKKCGKFPKDGKTLFPCAHSYCNGCFSDTVDQCLDCKAKVNIQVKNPLIEEIKMKYGYMNELVGVMIESSSIFTKPSLI